MLQAKKSKGVPNCYAFLVNSDPRPCSMKCEETVPCSRCVRNGLNCVHEGRRANATFKQRQGKARAEAPLPALDNQFHGAALPVAHVASSHKGPIAEYITFPGYGAPVCSVDGRDSCSIPLGDELGLAPGASGRV